MESHVSFIIVREQKSSSLQTLDLGSDLEITSVRTTTTILSPKPRTHYIEKYLSKEKRLRDYTMATRERQSFTRAFYYLWEMVLTESFNSTNF